MIHLYILLAVSLASSPAQDTVSCTIVKKAVAQYGEATVESWARLKGMAEKDIEKARRCLK